MGGLSLRRDDRESVSAVECRVSPGLSLLGIFGGHTCQEADGPYHHLGSHCPSRKDNGCRDADGAEECVGAAIVALGGFIFWFLGIHAPVLRAVVMGFLSLLPAVGAAAVWLPVAIYFLATGAVWQGLVLIAYGAFVIGLVDNLLRPTSSVVTQCLMRDRGDGGTCQGRIQSPEDG